MKEEKRIILEGNLLYYDEKNLNGRTYSKECILKAIKDYKDLINNGSSYGHFGYPEDSNLIQPDKISHIVTDISINEKLKSISGTLEILNTPEGEKIKHLCEVYKRMDKPIGLSCRPRSTGTINKNGEVEEFNLISFDIVNSDEDSFKDFDDNKLKIKEE